MPQGIEGSNSSAEQRSRFRGIQIGRNSRYRFMPRQHVFLISTVASEPRDRFIAASNKVPAAAGVADKIVSAMPAGSHSIAFLPFRYSLAHFVDDAGNFMPRNARVRDSRPEAVLQEVVAETNAAGMYFDPHLADTRSRNVALLNLKIRSRLSGNGSSHLRHSSSPRIFARDSFLQSCQNWPDLMRRDGGRLGGRLRRLCSKALDWSAF